MRYFRIFFGILALMCLAGCSTCKPVVVERVVNKTDSLYNASQRVDTFRIHDSVYVETYTMGDTVYKTRVDLGGRRIIKKKTDTVYKTEVRCDSVQVPVPFKYKTSLRGGLNDFWVNIIIIVVFLLLWFGIGAFVRRKFT
jgi:hypothetical protein